MMPAGLSPIQIRMPPPPVKVLHPGHSQMTPRCGPVPYGFANKAWSSAHPLEPFPHHFQFWRDRFGMPHDFMSLTALEARKVFRESGIHVNSCQQVSALRLSDRDLTALGVRHTDLARLFLSGTKSSRFKAGKISDQPLFSDFLRLVIRTCPARPLVFTEVGFGSLLDHLFAAIKQERIEIVVGVEKDNVVWCAKDILKSAGVQQPERLLFSEYEIPESDIILCVAPRPSQVQQIVEAMSKKVRLGGSLIVVPDGVCAETFASLSSQEWRLVLDWTTDNTPNDVFASYHLLSHQTMLWWRRV